MFSDPLMSLMGMLLLCFMGMLVMFLFVMRSLAAQTSEMQEAFEQQQGTLADIERQLMDVKFSLRQKTGEEGGQGSAADAGQMQLPLMQQGPDLMSMLDSMSKDNPGKPLFFSGMPGNDSPAPRKKEDEDDSRLFEEELLSDLEFAAEQRSRGNRNRGLGGNGGSLIMK